MWKPGASNSYESTRASVGWDSRSRLQCVWYYTAHICIYIYIYIYIFFYWVYCIVYVSMYTRVTIYKRLAWLWINEYVEISRFPSWRKKIIEFIAFLSGEWTGGPRTLFWVLLHWAKCYRWKIWSTLKIKQYLQTLGFKKKTDIYFFNFNKKYLE